jgi:PKD repeat protein
MKSNLIVTLAVISLYVGKVNAQPQYSFNNYAKVDSTYITSIASTTDIGLYNFLQTGEAYEWDFPNLEIVTQRDFLFKSRDNSGYRTNFLLTCVLNTGNYLGCLNTWNNLSNLAKSQNEGVFLVEAEIENFTEFQRSSTQKIEATMIGVTLRIDGSSIQIPIQYTSPDVLMKLPLEISSKDSSISGFSNNFGPLGYNLTIMRWQKRVNHVDGWGSLQTPYGYFPQTIRMLSRVERIDSIIYETDTTAIPSIEIQAQWWSPTHGQPVFSALGTETAEGVVFLSASFIDSLRCLNPIALFTSYPVQPTISANEGYVDVTFINLSQNGTNYSWNFGDSESGANNTSTLKNPSHRYSAGGVFEVNLIVRSEVCETPPVAEITIPIMIADTADVSASFTFLPSAPIAYEALQFTSQTQNAFAYFWDFGDGSTSFEQHPSHSFTLAGEYSVSLTASNTTKQATHTEVLNILPVTSIGEIIDSNLTIYPNPTSGKCTIELPSHLQQGITIEIYSILGTKVFSTRNAEKSTNQFEVDLSKLPAGIYKVVAKTNLGNLKRMLVKN